MIDMIRVQSKVGCTIRGGSFSSSSRETFATCNLPLVLHLCFTLTGTLRPFTFAICSRDFPITPRVRDSEITATPIEFVWVVLQEMNHA
jgi:hypothetical protein